MLDLALIRSEPERVKAALARRGVGPAAVDAVCELDALWTERGEVREALRHRRRRIAEEVARARREGGGTADLEALGRGVGDELAAADADLAAIEARRLEALYALPNLPATDTPDEHENGRGPFPGGGPPWPKPFAPLHHADIIEILRLVHPSGNPPGRGFLTWRGRGARLVRALADLALDVHSREFGCEEVRPPALASRTALTGSGHLPLLEDKMYPIGGAGPADLFLAPRAEPHLANLCAGRVLEASALPLRFVSAGPAFRREAGAGGAMGRGLVRLHQFDTVEVYVFTAPAAEDEELARAVRAAETILARLEVPYRRRLRAAPDLSHAAAKTVDMEVWCPGMEKGAAEKGSDPLSVQGSDPFTSPGMPCDEAGGSRTEGKSRGQWLPVAAISSFTDYQARRTDTRFRDAAGHMRFVHTIGGAAVALSHLIAALLENGQEADGSVRLPPALAERFGEAALTV
jgi:seryl-tRNA synthetase